MPRKQKPEKREPGLFKNGSRWWIRVRSPLTGRVSKRSTGTEDLSLANKIASMLGDMAERREQWDWLDTAERGDVALDLLFDRFAAGTLHALRAAREVAAETDNDVDLDPWVEKWAREHIAVLDVCDEHKGHYEKQVRAYIPAGERFPRSRLTEDFIKAKTAALVHPSRGTPLSSTTRRRYAESLRRFCKYARKRVPLVEDPFDDSDEWLPHMNSPRSQSWDHATRLRVLDAMEGEARVFMALVFGSGIELGAALALQGRHIGHEAGERVIVAPGSKNEHREERTIFVDAWAWPIVQEHARNIAPRASLWQTLTPSRDGAEVRKAFYEAQVKCGLIEAPAVNKTTGKRLWKAVNPHTIHDARHTYVVIRMLGMDGEPRQDIRFCSVQLGHADEQMCMRIYAKANIRERLRQIELREAMEAGRREAAKAA